jgi:putative pyrroloquinoline-quinone binding quinoprotein
MRLHHTIAHAQTRRRPSKRPTSRAFIGTAALLAVLTAASGCGAGGTTSSQPPAGQAATAAAQPATAAVSPAPGSAALNPATLIGKTLFGLNDSNAACQASLDGTATPGLPDAQGSAPGDDSQTDTANAVATGNGTLVPGGLLILPCAPSASVSSSEIIAFNLFTRKMAWTFSLSGYDSWTIGTEHLFLISHHTTPAQGLQSASTKYTLTAVSVSTGQESWSVPYHADSPNDADSGNGIVELTEGPSGIAAHPQSVVVTYLGTSAYDAETGASVWHVPTVYDTPASGSYALDGVVEIYGYQDNLSDSHITGFDAKTGSQVWDLRLSQACDTSNRPEDDFFVGSVEWEFGSTCVEAHNVATGQLVADETFPTSWQSSVATPQSVLAYDGSELSFFNVPDLHNPVWSQPAGSTTPLAISTGHSLVQAPSGLLVLSNTNGSITASVSSATFTGNEDFTVVDGLVSQDAVDGSTSVLELDPPGAG